MPDKGEASEYIGIRKVLSGLSLGELEAQILDIMWDMDPPITARQVFRVMYPRRGLSYSTIFLTLGRMESKGILSRRKSGPKKTDPFVHTPRISREKMAAILMHRIAEHIMHLPLPRAIARLCGAEDDSAPISLAPLYALLDERW